MGLWGFKVLEILILDNLSQTAPALPPGTIKPHQIKSKKGTVGLQALCSIITYDLSQCGMQAALQLTEKTCQRL